MPIGKNSIKRAVNNGYSKVKTTAPDMENSVVVEEKPAVKKTTTAKKPATKKAVTTKKAETVKKAVETKQTAPKKPTIKLAEVKKYQIGEELPIYLL